MGIHSKRLVKQLILDSIVASSAKKQQEEKTYKEWKIKIKKKKNLCEIEVRRDFRVCLCRKISLRRHASRNFR